MWNQILSPNSVLPQWNLQYEWITATKTLVVLDDVWSLAVLEPLLFKIPGCRFFFMVSRFKLPTVLNATYDVELLREEEALSLFCHSAFGQKSTPWSPNPLHRCNSSPSNQEADPNPKSPETCCSTLLQNQNFPNPRSSLSLFDGSEETCRRPAGRPGGELRR
ncbi:hypothetical protein C1H46_019990 [Malus baccata]|uniref:NB-ARC domain-containing protein n=1 Tax=Malus baccata TaxID=106549 RepID=A0A540M6L3_MALBA|nr:hypothetical protein C1H46_019990 [Malus baccata]